jgi:urease accessory protein
MASDWLIWQLVDSAFPSGSFTHSAGLEAAWQQGMVCDAKSLESFLQMSLRQLEQGVLKLVDQAWDDPERFREIDSECDLFLNNHVANRASRAMGRSMLSAAAKVFELPEIVSLARRVREEKPPGHLAPTFGCLMRSLRVDRATVLNLFAFSTLRSQISAAVRLGIVGPMQGQQIQARLSQMPKIDPDSLGTSHPVQISPLTDLIQATQDRLYSRLFQS